MKYLKKQLRLRPSPVQEFLASLFIPGALRFIKYDYVLGRRSRVFGGVLPKVAQQRLKCSIQRTSHSGVIRPRCRIGY
jgi:hypothetical protein